MWRRWRRRILSRSRPRHRYVPSLHAVVPRWSPQRGGHPFRCSGSSVERRVHCMTTAEYRANGERRAGGKGASNLRRQTASPLPRARQRSAARLFHRPSRTRTRPMPACVPPPSLSGERMAATRPSFEPRGASSAQSLQSCRALGKMRADTGRQPGVSPSTSTRTGLSRRSGRTDTLRPRSVRTTSRSRWAPR